MSSRKTDLFSQLTTFFKSGSPAIRAKVKEQIPSAVNVDNRFYGNLKFLSRTFNNNGMASSSHNFQDRSSRLQDYNEMDSYALVNAALDIYADEATSQDINGRTLHIYSENPAIKTVLDDLFNNVVNFEFNARPWVRNVVKYGDFFLYNQVTPGQGITNVVPIPVNDLQREEGFDPENPLAYRFRLSNGKHLESWEVAHVRLLGNDVFLPYGTSVIDGARRTWRQIVMLEDSMLVYRITRAVDRRVFYVDIGGIPADEVDNFMEQAKVSVRSQSVVDRSTGRVDLRYAAMSIEDDYWLPTRGPDTGTKIDTLPAGNNQAQIDDVEYIRKLLIASLKVPSAYLNYSDAVTGASALSQVDIRFSRTINMLQRTIVSELNKLALIHLYVLGFRGSDLINFELRLSNPSTIAQQQKLDLMKQKFEIASASPTLADVSLLSEKWVYKNVLGLNEQEILNVRRERLEDVRAKAALEAVSVISQQGSDLDLAQEPTEETETPPPENEPSLDTAGDDHGDADLILDTDDSSLPVRVFQGVRKSKKNSSLGDIKEELRKSIAKAHVEKEQTNNSNHVSIKPFVGQFELNMLHSIPLGSSSIFLNETNATHVFLKNVSKNDEKILEEEDPLKFKLYATSNDG